VTSTAAAKGHAEAGRQIRASRRAAKPTRIAPGFVEALSLVNDGYPETGSVGEFLTPPSESVASGPRP